MHIVVGAIDCGMLLVAALPQRFLEPDDLKAVEDTLAPGLLLAEFLELRSLHLRPLLGNLFRRQEMRVVLTDSGLPDHRRRGYLW